MATVGLIAHPGRDQAQQLLAQAEAWLRDNGHTAVRIDEHTAFGALDVGVSLGGDGTMLRAVHLLSPAGVPVLGVNVGHLGYLTAVEPTALLDALACCVSGRYEVEERMTLEVDVDGDRRLALNEAVLEKTSSGNTVRLAVAINGRFFATYAADGLILATPTGSTAYNFSARGPIVSPRHEAIVVTPVSPHMLFGWSLVLDPSEEVTVELVDGRSAAVVVDGQSVATLASGQPVTCRRSPHPARLIALQSRDFHQLLKAKFGLPDR